MELNYFRKFLLIHIFKETRKILLTGQANHADTIRAVNEAHIDNYFEKPWIQKIF
jgi:two-component system chemotaxis response regulator CheY